MKPNIADPRTRIHAVRIVAVGGQTVRFVEYPHDLVMGQDSDGPIVYQADQGYQFTGYSATATLTPGVLDLQGVLAAAGIDRDQITSGVWDGARCYVFATSWANPVEDEEPIAQCLFGKTRLQDGRYVVEMMQLIDALNQSTGRTCGPLCDWTLFDETLDGDIIPYHRSRCSGPRSNPDGPRLADHIVTGTITHVTDRLQFRDSARGEAADWFGAGSIRFTTGANAGLRSQEIKGYDTDGTIRLFLAAHYPVEIGDEYEMVPGCRKRRAEDCVAKFGNAVNNGSFDRVPVQSVYREVGMGG